MQILLLLEPKFGHDPIGLPIVTFTRKLISYSAAYSVPFQTSMMEIFCERS